MFVKRSGFRIIGSLGGLARGGLVRIIPLTYIPLFPLAGFPSDDARLLLKSFPLTHLVTRPAHAHRVRKRLLEFCLNDQRGERRGEGGGEGDFYPLNPKARNKMKSKMKPQTP